MGEKSFRLKSNLPWQLTHSLLIENGYLRIVKEHQIPDIKSMLSSQVVADDKYLKFAYPTDFMPRKLSSDFYREYFYYYWLEEHTENYFSKAESSIQWYIFKNRVLYLLESEERNQISLLEQNRKEFEQQIPAGYKFDYLKLYDSINTFYEYRYGADFCYIAMNETQPLIIINANPI